MNVTTTAPAGKPQQRTLRVISPFERMASGRILGGVKITTPPPYAATDLYVVTIDGNEVLFSKQNGDRSDSTVDMDMGCCSCAGFGYRRQCRHVSAIVALKAKGII